MPYQCFSSLEKSKRSVQPVTDMYFYKQYFYVVNQ